MGMTQKTTISELNKSECEIDRREGTRIIYTLPQIADMVKAGNISIERAIEMAYCTGINDMRKMSMEEVLVKGSMLMCQAKASE